MADNPQTTQTNGTVHYEPERKKRAKDRGTPNMQPPLTPMIDVVFQLLLFFLLSCQFRQEEGAIPSRLPNIAGQEPVSMDVKPIEVRVLAIGDNNKGVCYEVTGVAITSAPLLYGHLQGIQATFGKDRPVVIKPTSKVRWMHVVNAFNQAVRLEFKTIGFASPTS